MCFERILHDLAIQSVPTNSVDKRLRRDDTDMLRIEAYILVNGGLRAVKTQCHAAEQNGTLRHRWIILDLG